MLWLLLLPFTAAFWLAFWVLALPFLILRFVLKVVGALVILPIVFILGLIALLVGGLAFSAVFLLPLLIAACFLWMLARLVLPRPIS